MWSYFERMLQMLQELPAYKNLNGAELIASCLSEPKYIWMRRRNRVEQAVSWDMACQTGVWAQRVEEKSTPHATPKFDFKVIDEWCNRIAAHDDGWANYFRENQIEPLILFYEDVVASHRTAAERVLEFLELPFPPDLEIPPPAVEKQANQISQRMGSMLPQAKRSEDRQACTCPPAHANLNIPREAPSQRQRIGSKMSVVRSAP